MATATSRPPNTPPEERGHIEADSIYTLDAIKWHLGLGGHAMRVAQRKGLRARRIGRRKFVLGRDLIAYIEAAAE